MVIGVDLGECICVDEGMAGHQSFYFLPKRTWGRRKPESSHSHKDSTKPSQMNRLVFESEAGCYRAGNWGLVPRSYKPHQNSRNSNHVRNLRHNLDME